MADPIQEARHDDDHEREDVRKTIESARRARARTSDVMDRIDARLAELTDAILRINSTLEKTARPSWEELAGDRRGKT